MATRTQSLSKKLKYKLGSLLVLAMLILLWHTATRRPEFQSEGYTEEQLMTMEFNGDIIRDENDQYIFNPDKMSGIPGPLAVAKKCFEELSNPLHKNGTNDHGILHLVRYTVTRFAIGFLLASVIAVTLGILIGLSPALYETRLELGRSSSDALQSSSPVVSSNALNDRSRSPQKTNPPAVAMAEVVGGAG